MQKFSSFGRKKKQTKIRHRMVMLEGLQLFTEIRKNLLMNFVEIIREIFNTLQRN